MRRVCIAAGLSKLAGVDASENEVNAAVASTVPLGKVGAKWDIAIAAVFLCSSAARHLTGVITAPAKLAMEWPANLQERLARLLWQSKACHEAVLNSICMMRRVCHTGWDKPPAL